MNMNVAANRFTTNQASEMVSVGTNHRKEYLKKRWQELVDINADKHKAIIMLLDIEEGGYEICLSSRQVQGYYDNGRIHEATGADFLDLVRGYGRMIMVEDSTTDIRLAGAKEVILGFKSLVGIPIYDHHEDLTALFVMMSEEKNALADQLMMDFGWLVTGIEESIRYLAVEEEINDIRNVDPLTRLISRDRMMSVLQLEFARSQRSDIPFSMVLVDIDNFRQINENFGHDVGDRVLKEFSEQIASRIRMVDTACRWNGDAFAILCPQTDLLGVNVLVNDLFSSLTHHIFPNVGRCYFSIGIADYSPKDVTINDMLLRLDKALYRVKVFGGNGHKTNYHN